MLGQCKNSIYEQSILLHSLFEKFTFYFILLEVMSNGLIRLEMEYLQVVILGCNQPQDATMYLIRYIYKYVVIGLFTYDCFGTITIYSLFKKGIILEHVYLHMAIAMT